MRMRDWQQPCQACRALNSLGGLPFSWKDRVPGRECKYSRGTICYETQKVTCSFNKRLLSARVCAPGTREVGGALRQDLTLPGSGDT